MKKNQGIYRGKSVETNEWVIGYYVNCELPVIFERSCKFADLRALNYTPVYSETVGRLLNRPCYDSQQDNKEIFQGDIVQIWRNRHADIDHAGYDTVGVVVDEDTILSNCLGYCFPQDTTRVKVIGNVYDNPDLLDDQTLMFYLSCVCDTPDNYNERHTKIMDNYDVHGSIACCYLCNFEPEGTFCYLCCHLGEGHTCKHIETCVDIYKKEHKQEE
nr:YopX family protein [uncultured Mediterraneibacter sp.]